MLVFIMPCVEKWTHKELMNECLYFIKNLVKICHLNKVEEIIEIIKLKLKIFARFIPEVKKLPLMSPPAQKAFSPAPLMITSEMLGSSSQETSWGKIRRTMDKFKALSALGRCSVITPVWLIRWKRTPSSAWVDILTCAFFIIK